MTTIFKKPNITRVSDVKPGTFKTIVVVIPLKNGETKAERVDDGKIKLTPSGNAVFDSSGNLFCKGDARVSFLDRGIQNK